MAQMVVSDRSESHARLALLPRYTGSWAIHETRIKQIAHPRGTPTRDTSICDLGNLRISQRSER